MRPRIAPGLPLAPGPWPYLPTHRPPHEVALAKPWTPVHSPIGVGFRGYRVAVAARRLLAAMLVFLAISTVLAALAPRPTDPEDERGTRTTTTTTAVREPKPAGGDLVRRRARLRLINGELRAQPELLRVRAGDQLALEVSAPRVLTLEIASLGITETAGPDDPARIDLFLSGAGRHVLRNASSGRRLLRIEVQNRSKQPTREGPIGGPNS